MKAEHTMHLYNNRRFHGLPYNIGLLIELHHKMHDFLILRMRNSEKNQWENHKITLNYLSHVLAVNFFFYYWISLATFPTIIFDQLHFWTDNSTQKRWILVVCFNLFDTKCTYFLIISLEKGHQENVIAHVILYWHVQNCGKNKQQTMAIIWL